MRPDPRPLTPRSGYDMMRDLKKTKAFEGPVLRPQPPRGPARKPLVLPGSLANESPADPADTPRDATRERGPTTQATSGGADEGRGLRCADRLPLQQKRLSMSAITPPCPLGWAIVRGELDTTTC
jgi:hypothetical protein